MSLYEDKDQPARRPHPLERGPESARPNAPHTPSERIIINMPQVRPILTYVLIAINIIIFVMGEASISLNEQLFRAGWSSPMLVFGDGEYYRLFTSMFLHAGAAHLFFNMYALYILGMQTEQMYGRWRYMVIYFLGGVTGSILSASFGEPTIPSVGASGAVFALLGTQILYFYRNQATLGAYGRGALRQYLILLGINLVIGFSIARIDNLGHIGGLIGGAVLGGLLAPTLNSRRGVDPNGAPVRVVYVEQRGGSPAVLAGYAVILLGFTLFAGIWLF